MKTYKGFALGILFLFIPQSFAQKLKDWSWYSTKELEYLVQENQQTKRLAEIELIEHAKKSIFTGDIRTAELLLSKVSNIQSRIKLIKDYYLSLIYFIKNDHDKANQLIAQINKNYFSSQTKACFLSLSIALTQEVQKVDQNQLEVCKQLLEFSQNTTTSFYWFDKMIQIKKGRMNYVVEELLQESTNIDSSDQFESWMKLAILVGQEQIVRDRLLFTDEKILNLPSIRELSSVVYYNISDFNNASSAVEGLHSVNALNITGLLNLRKQNFENAFDHFNQAYELNPFSENALEKLLALSHHLNKWDFGDKYTNSLPNQSFEESIASYLFKAIFKQKLRKNDQALRYINALSASVKTYHSPLINQLKIVNAYYKKSPVALESYTKEACLQNDGFSCWLYSQVALGETFDKPIYTERSHQSYSQRYQNLVTGQISSEKETYPIVIDQKDIEELDSLEEKLL